MKLYVVGFGPGENRYMTIEAKNAIEDSELIVGYTVYVDLVKKAYADKEYYTTVMTKEADRCRYAIEQCIAGKKTAIVCSGDSGIYGMASLVYEIASEYEEDIDIEVVAGVTAAASGGAVLGAPLTHDFAVISLSDLMTPLELIFKRVECAAMADFCICIYNPSSRKRHDYLERACKIVLRHKSEDTICGYVRNIGREDEEAHILTLGELKDTKTDMFTTVFIGNASTEIINGKMVTKRGYQWR